MNTLSHTTIWLLVTGIRSRVSGLSVSGHRYPVSSQSHQCQITCLHLLRSAFDSCLTSGLRFPVSSQSHQCQITCLHLLRSAFDSCLHLTSHYPAVYSCPPQHLSALNSLLSGRSRTAGDTLPWCEHSLELSTTRTAAPPVYITCSTQFTISILT